MGLRSVIQRRGLLRMGLIVLAVVAAVMAGASSLAYQSPYAPLIVGVIVAAAVILGFSLAQPSMVLYAAIFMIFLPVGLIPARAHSLLNRALTVMAFGVWLLDLLARRRRVVWSSTALLMLGFVAWSTITLLWTANLSASTTALQAYALRLVLFLLVVPNAVRTPESLNGMMNTLALGGWALILVSAGTVLLQGYIPGTRFRTLDVNENAAGILALLALSGILWRATRPAKRRKWLRISLAVVFLSLSIGVTAISGSRGSAISLLIVIWAFWVWKPTRPWATVGLLILVVAALSAPFIFSTTLDRFAGQPGDTLLGGREALWQAAWMIIRDHPWRGVGIGNAPYAVVPHVRILRSVQGYESTSIHNPLLTIWAETGVPGLLLYLGVLGTAVWSFARQYNRQRKASIEMLMPYFALVASVFLGYMLSWIKGGGMESNHTYFLMLALLLIPGSLQTEGPKESRGHQAAGRGPLGPDRLGSSPGVTG